jgi:hypothetical protein
MQAIETRLERGLAPVVLEMDLPHGFPSALVRIVAERFLLASRIRRSTMGTGMSIFRLRLPAGTKFAHPCRLTMRA